MCGITSSSFLIIIKIFYSVNYLLNNGLGNVCLYVHRSKPALGIKPSRFSRVMIQEPTINQQTSTVGTRDENDLFKEMKHRFLSFKKHKFL